MKIIPTTVAVLLTASAVGAAAFAATITGTNGNDTLRGTARADVINGNAGNDRIYALAGNDRVNGGQGKDRIFCGVGIDRVKADRLDVVAKDCEIVTRPALTPTPKPSPTPTPTPPSPALGTRTNPYPLGTTVVLAGTNGWSMRVNGSTPDATSAVMAENQFNDPPAAGKQFFMFSLTLTYNGTGSDSLFAITPYLAAVGASNVAYSAGLRDWCGVIPGHLGTDTVFSGGTVNGNDCFSVLTTDAASLVLFFDRSGQQTFFALR